jgi:serine phosphatase RsbU (regulator of sigma subunit)
MAAVSIDNALLYAREQRIAEALQRGLLPGDLATPDGVEVAHRYRPPSGQIVGGDWSDLVPLPAGRSALIVGDAMGHGAEAAAVMAQLRAAANALAGLDLPPGTLLRRLDQMASRLNSATFATCVYAVLDPTAGSCLISVAGHLPPVLTHPDGRTELVDVPPGLPLGLDDEAHAAVEVRLPPGAILALYTDGLVESRVRSFDEGIVALRAALAGRHGPLPGICDSVLGRLCGHDDGHGEDDTTLVLARIPGLPVPRNAADDL